MRSVTSYFNPTLFKKNLSRFWPLWVCYTLLWVAILPLNLLSWWWQSGTYMTDRTLRLKELLWQGVNIPDLLSETLFVSLGYGAVCALAVFSYLYHHRAAATVHALPLRREELFLTNYLSGITFFLLPNLVAFLLLAGVEMALLGSWLGPCLRAALVWLVGKSAIELFFFSLAVFCAMFTGNLMAMPVFYGIVNLLVYALYYLGMALGEVYYYGVTTWGEPAWVRWLTPAYALSEGARWDCVYAEVFPQSGDYVFTHMGLRDPAVIWVYVLAALVLAALALVFYRKRHIETAGDVISVSWVRPIFRWGVALCTGASFGLLTCAFFGWTRLLVPTMVSMSLWTGVGYFAAEMLLQKSFRVFRIWKSCLVAMVLMVAFVAGMEMDLLGVETRVPQADRVEEIRLRVSGTYPSDGGSYSDPVLTEPAQIQAVVDLHQAIVDDYTARGHSSGDEYTNIRMEYTLTNGSTMSRSYYSHPLNRADLHMPDTVTGQLHALINDPAWIRRAYGLDEVAGGLPLTAVVERAGVDAGGYRGSITYIYEETLKDGSTAHYAEVSVTEGVEELWQGVQADFAAGDLGRRYLFNDGERYENTYYTDLRLTIAVPSETYEPGLIRPEAAVTAARDKQIPPEGYYVQHISVTLTPRAQNTLRVLEQYAGLGRDWELAPHPVRWDRTG